MVQHILLNFPHVDVNTAGPAGWTPLVRSVWACERPVGVWREAEHGGGSAWSHAFGQWAGLWGCRVRELEVAVHVQSVW